MCSGAHICYFCVKPLNIQNRASLVACHFSVLSCITCHFSVLNPTSFEWIDSDWKLACLWGMLYFLFLFPFPTVLTSVSFSTLNVDLIVHHRLKYWIALVLQSDHRGSPPKSDDLLLSAFPRFIILAALTLPALAGRALMCTLRRVCPADWGRWSFYFPSSLPWWDHIWRTASSSGLASSKKTGNF